MGETGVFGEYARYYDLLYKDKDYGAEADYIHRLIKRWRPGAASILELGSGTGKHACLLADRGYAVHGIERSCEMLAGAEQRAQERQRADPMWRSPTYSQGDIRTARLARTFDVAISLFHVISYQVKNEDVLAAFKTARAHLDEGGLFLFDVWYGPAVLTDRPAVRIKRMADDRIEVTRITEPAMHPNESVVDVNFHVFVRDNATGEVTETRETHCMRYFFRTEISLLAQASGFSFAHGEEWLTAAPLGCQTWGASFALQAQEQPARS